jgi:hypothetical protein
MIALTAACRAPIVDGGTTTTVKVHVESNAPDAVLARVADSASATVVGPGGVATGFAEGYEHICSGSCDVAVPTNQRYMFLNVSGFQGHSDTFQLPARDSATLRVDSGSQALWVTGWTGMILGATGVVIGGLLWGAGSAGGQESAAGAGEAIALISLPVIALSIWAMHANRTRVTTDGGSELVRARSRNKAGFGLTARGVGWRF